MTHCLFCFVVVVVCFFFFFLKKNQYRIVVLLALVMVNALLSMKRSVFARLDMSEKLVNMNALDGKYDFVSKEINLNVNFSFLFLFYFIF